MCSAIPYLYSFLVSNNAEGCNSTYDVSNACEIPPFNDNITCSNYYAIPQLILGETVSASNDYATASTYIPSCNDVVDRQDLWFLINPDTNVVVDITTIDGFSLQLWEGNCSALTQVSGACAQNVLEDVSIAANTFYYLQVWSDNSSGRSTNSGDFEITVQEANLSIVNIDLENFKVFPNPFKDEVSLSSRTSIDQIYIYDLLGKLIQVNDVDSICTTLNLSEYKSGIYFLKVISDNASVTQKIIKL